MSKDSIIEIGYYQRELCVCYSWTDLIIPTSFSALLLFIEDGTWYNGDLAMKINPVTTFETQTEEQFNDYIKELYDYSETEPSWHYLCKDFTSVF